MAEYSLAVIIGRFSPPHNQHLNLIQTALQTADNVLIFLGSSNAARTFKNPFTFQERATMIHHALTIDERKRVQYIPLEDQTYNDQAWVNSIQTVVSKVCSDDSKIVFVGHIKDASSYYIKMFPQWKFKDVGYSECLHATQIRELFFKEDNNLNYLAGVVPSSVSAFLEEFKKTQAFTDIVKEREFIKKYRKQYSQLPYSPIFVTVDAVVIQSGHILLVKRKAYPGKGLLTLPGGFVDANTDRSIEDAMVRELFEETGIKVPEKVIRGNIKKVKVYDAIDRSARGRTITHCHMITFMEGEWNLPKLRAGDDAEKAEWHTFSSLKSEDFFEDHFQLISDMTGFKLGNV
jgi:bifunctional NMN adenylyltransferase/nudix hydrolase